MDRVDILLLHWQPLGAGTAPSLRLLQNALKAGLTHHIGVSNYTVQLMRDSCAIVDAPSGPLCRVARENFRRSWRTWPVITKPETKDQRAGQPRLCDAEATKARILQLAKKEFAQNGLGGARVDVISEKARAKIVKISTGPSS